MNDKTLKYINEFNKKNYKRYSFIVSKKDTEIIEKLESLKSSRCLSNFIRLAIENQLKVEKMVNK